MPNAKPLLSRHNLYKHADSSSYVENGTTFNIEYGSGPVAGKYSRDTVAIGQMKLANYLFAEVDDESGLGLAPARSETDCRL